MFCWDRPQSFCMPIMLSVATGAPCRWEDNEQAGLTPWAWAWLIAGRTGPRMPGRPISNLVMPSLPVSTLPPKSLTLLPFTNFKLETLMEGILPWERGFCLGSSLHRHSGLCFGGHPAALPLPREGGTIATMELNGPVSVLLHLLFGPQNSLQHGTSLPDWPRLHSGKRTLGCS